MDIPAQSRPNHGTIMSEKQRANNSKTGGYHISGFYGIKVR